MFGTHKYGLELYTVLLFASVGGREYNIGRSKLLKQERYKYVN